MRIADRESDVLTACLQYLAVKGIFAWRQNQGAIPRKGGGYRRFVGLRGVSDILGILPQRRRWSAKERCDSATCWPSK